MNVALAKINDLDKKQTTALPIDDDNFDISDLDLYIMDHNDDSDEYVASNNSTNSDLLHNQSLDMFKKV